jgi:hypothetical protein
VVVLTAGADLDSEGAADCRIRRCEQLFQREERFVLVIDARNATRSKGRDRVREWIGTLDEGTLRKMYGVAVLIPSAIGRFMVSATLLVLSQPVPYKVFETLEDAVAWAREVSATRR